MATGALVALADEHLDIEESFMVQTMVVNAEALKLHDLELATAIFIRYVASLQSDPEAGREAALKAIAMCREDIEAAEVIIRVGIAVAKADSQLSRFEIDTIEQICARLEISGLDVAGLIGAPPDSIH